MKKLSTVWLSVIAMSFSLSSLAQTPKDSKSGLEGIINVSGWSLEAPGKAKEQNIKGSARVDGWINITKNGCVKLKARLTTGDKFNNETFNSGLGTSEPEFTLALRHLYVSASCIKNLTVEAGAVPVRSFGSLGLSNNGMVDGLNVIIIDEENGREYIASIGQISVDPHLLDRELNDLNHINVQIKQAIGGSGSGFVSLAKYGNKYISRVGMSWVLNEYIAWVNEVGAEAIMMDDRLMGGRSFARFSILGFDTNVTLSHISPDPSDADRLAFLLKQFYGYGTNGMFEVSKLIRKDLTANFRFRVGDAGPLVMGGLTYRFKIQR